MSRDRRRVRRSGRPVVPTASQYRQSTPKTKSRRGHNRWKYAGGLLILLVVVGGLWWLGRIDKIEVEAASAKAEILTLVEEKLDNPFWNRHLLLLDAERIATQLEETNPDLLADITIRRNWLSRAILVKADVRRPVIVWVSGGVAYGVDQKGVVTTRLSGGELSSAPAVTDATNLEVEIGQLVAPERFVQFVLEISAKLKAEVGLVFQGARIIDTTNELYVDTDAGYYLRLDTTRKAEEQLAALKSVLKNGADPTQYVDLRLPHKVYYQ